MTSKDFVGLGSIWAFAVAIILAATSCRTGQSPADADTALRDTGPCARSASIRFEALVDGECRRERLRRISEAACEAGHQQGCELADKVQKWQRYKRSVTAETVVDVAQLACEAGEGDGCAIRGVALRDAERVEAATPRLIRGCQLGSAVSCSELTRAFFAGDIDDAQLDSVEQMAASRCESGLAAACDLHVDLKLGRAEKGDFAQYQQRCVDRDDAASCYVAGTLLYQGRAEGSSESQAKLLRRGCDLGSLSACSTYAAHLLRGDPAPKTVEEALDIHRRSCEAGAAGSCLHLGAYRSRGQYGEQDYGRALQLLERACRAGFHAGCGELGSFYEQGLLVPRDYETARKLYRWGCEAGVEQACIEGGRMLSEGLGGPADLAKATEMLATACYQSSARDACRLLSEAHANANRPADASAALRQACLLSDAQACSRLAHQKAAQGETQAAAAFYEQSCQAGLSSSCVAASDLLHHADASSDELRRATLTAEKACEDGVARLCWRAADGYRFGWGVASNADAANRLSQRAAELYQERCQQHDAEACRFAAHAVAHAARGDKDLKSAQDFLEDGCRKDLDGTCMESAVQYVVGELRVPDRQKGLLQLNELCEAGDSYACFWLAYELSFHAQNDAERSRGARKMERLCTMWRDKRACSDLSMVYLQGGGVEQDLDAAHRYADMSCADGTSGEKIGCGYGALVELRRIGEEETIDGLVDSLHHSCEVDGERADCTSLARLYEQGFQVERDTSKALKYYELGCASERNSPEGCARRDLLAAATKGEPKEASPKQWSRACEQGDAQACVDLARHQEFGSDAVDRFETATQTYRRACESGSEPACAVYLMLSFEEGMPYGQAHHDEVAWACEQGSAELCYSWAEYFMDVRWSRAVELHQMGCQKGLKASCRRLQTSGEALPAKTAAAGQDAGSSGQ